MSSAWSSQEIQSKNNNLKQFLINRIENLRLHLKDLNFFVGQTAGTKQTVNGAEGNTNRVNC